MKGWHHILICMFSESFLTGNCTTFLSCHNFLANFIKLCRKIASLFSKSIICRKLC